MLAGVLLAIGFQVLLSALSIAIGFSAIGNVEKKNTTSSDGNDSSGDSGSTPASVKISTGLGVWTLLTSSIALFFASLLAVKLSLIGNDITGITLGLVIWATFFTAMAYLEGKAAKTMLGTLMSTVSTFIRNTASTLQSAFTPGEAKNTAKVAEKAVEAIRNELDDALDLRPITQKVDEYVDRLERQAERTPDYEQIKHDFIRLLQDIRIEEKTGVGNEGDLDTTSFVKLASEQPNLSKSDVKNLKNTFEEARRAVKEGNTPEEKGKNVVAQFTGTSKTDIDKYITDLETYLRNTERDEINPEVIRQDIISILQNPGNAQAILQNRASRIDRETMISMLATHRKMDRSKAEKVAHYVDEAIDWVAGKTNDAKKGLQGRQQRAMESSGTMQERLQQQAGEKTQGNGASDSLKSRLRQYLNSLNRPELRYEGLQYDVERIMKDPKASPRILKNRLSRFDRETFITLLSSNDRISRKDVENLYTKVDETREKVIMQVEKLEKEAETKARQAKQTVLHQAENARKTAATAAWWLFATAVISGAASALGGLIAL